MTGGAGFISSNMIRYLLHETAHDVVTMDALTYAGNMANLADVIDHERLRFIHGDIRDVADVTRALEGVDVIVNAAAESHVSKSIEEGGAEFVTTNVVGTQVLLDAMRNHPIERFILISSSEVYGTAETEPMDEDHPLNPRSPYAGTKAGGDRLAYSYWCTYDLPITIIRPFNNYGPYQHPEKVIPRFIIQALSDQPLTIHGNGQASRDWLHVFDTAEAITAACEVPLERIVGETINVATGIDETVEQIADVILDILGKPASLKRHVPDRPGQVDRHIGSTDKAARLLGWRSQHPLRRRARADHPLVPRQPGMVAGRPGLGADGAGRLTRPRTLVVLGGGPAQRHAIDAARALGVRTIVCDADPRVARRARLDRGRRGRAPRRPRRRRADRPRHRLAGAHRGRARPRICASPTRSRWRSRRRCTDKIAQRTRLDAAGVPQPRWSADAPPAYPCVVKAPDRQGQRAMAIVRDPAGLAEAAERARAGSRSGRVLYEQFVPGPEVTVNGFSIDGRIHVVAVTDRDPLRGRPRRRPPARVPGGRRRRRRRGRPSPRRPCAARGDRRRGRPTSS